MNHYLKIHYLKTNLTCPICGKVEDTKYWSTNNKAKFRKLWFANPSPYMKCHKREGIDRIYEGDEVMQEINNLSKADSRRLFMHMHFDDGEE